jgi:hypothetical protein
MPDTSPFSFFYPVHLCLGNNVVYRPEEFYTFWLRIPVIERRSPICSICHALGLVEASGAAHYRAARALE